MFGRAQPAIAADGSPGPRGRGAVRPAEILHVPFSCLRPAWPFPGSLPCRRRSCRGKVLTSAVPEGHLPPAPWETGCPRLARRQCCSLTGDARVLGPLPVEGLGSCPQGAGGLRVPACGRGWGTAQVWGGQGAVWRWVCITPGARVLMRRHGSAPRAVPRPRGRGGRGL